MRTAINTIIGILILQLFSCQEKALITDIEKLQLKKDIQFIFEQTYLLHPINDSVRKFNESVDYSESDYWIFNQGGYIVEHGHLITCEDSLCLIEKYSKEYPHHLKQMIHYFSDIDTMTFFDITFSREDTTFKKNIFL
nr:hypothetical protein [Bacteroidota bacterium]